MKKIFFYILLLTLAYTTQAQHESQYTHFAFNRSAFNPAYAGSKEDFTAGMLYRNQWSGIEGAPRTINAFLHAPFSNKKCGIGLNIYADQIGITNTMSAALDYNYKIKVGKGVLSAGIRAEGEYGSMDFSNIDPTDQIDNTISSNIQSGGRISPNFGGGLYYSTQKYFVGVSVPRFLKNHLYSEYPNGRDLRTAYASAGVILPVSSSLKLMPAAMISANPSTPWQYDLNVNAIFMNTIWLGGSYRVGDSVSGIAQYQFSPQSRLSMAYDFTTSPLKKASRGSFEIMLEHTFCNCAKENITNIRFF
jgi:type IX secretion system PorP/SprF family membrane protein